MQSVQSMMHPNVREVRNLSIGVNLGTFDEVLATIDINTPPLQGLDPGRTRFYKHIVPTGLKMFF